jgi:hypothetical protein
MRSPRPAVAEEQIPARVERPSRTVSPVYAKDPTQNWSVVDQPSSKSPEDKLLDLLKDRKYHTVSELERCLPGGAWAKAMRALVAKNYAFDRVKSYFKLRMRQTLEERQSMVELLEGIDLHSRSVVVVKPTEPEVKEPEIPEAEFNPTEDMAGEATEDLTNGLVLSDPPEALTIAAGSSVTMTAAILAKRNSGKTYLAMVLAEEMISAKHPIPVVILDPTGVWYGLRSWADGTPSTLKILVLGGSRGDASFTAKDGVKTAQAVKAVFPTSVVIDLSHLAPFEQHEFVADFGTEFYGRTERDPVHMIVDEADEYAPQQLNKGSRHHKRSLDAMDRLTRRGRNKGIGLTLITQRSAVISKNLLSQVDSMWFLNMVAPSDLRSADDWLSLATTSQQRSECMSQISRLPPGVAFFIQGGSFPKFRRFKVRRKKTFDSSRTPTSGSKVIPISAKPADAALTTVRSILSGMSTIEPEGQR